MMILRFPAILAILASLPTHLTLVRGAPTTDETLGEAELTARMDTLRRDVRERLPAISDDTMRAYRQQRQAVASALKEAATARKELESVAQAKGLVDHARRHWLTKAAKGIATAKAAIRQARTTEERTAALDELTKWQENKQAGLDALKTREAALAMARKKEPDFKARLAAAEKALDHARSAMATLIKEAGLDATLTSDALDGQLAQFFILSHATPKRLAAFAAEKPENATLVRQLLGDPALMIRMTVAEGAKDGQYGPAMRILENIRRASPRATNEPFSRLALATALEHAKPIKQRNPTAAKDAPTHINPVDRYLHYEKAFLAGDLDPGFKDLSTWELRFLVNAEEPDATLAWGREMLRNYRPDLIATPDERWRYVQLVRTDIPWTSAYYKDDRPDLQLNQNILMNAGTCGRRAVLGRFLLRAFGVPTIPRPQPRHASLARWTSSGWQICLGGTWGTGWTKTPYKSDLNFLAAATARAHPDAYLRIARAQWIGLAMGESRTWGLLNSNPEFWNGVALYTQRAINQTQSPLAQEPDDNPADEPTATHTIPDEHRRITTDRRGAITIPAAAANRPTTSQGRLLFMQSNLGGTQLHYRRLGPPQDFEYRIDAPAAGDYALTARLVTPSPRQSLQLTLNGEIGPVIELPHTVGLWSETKPVTIKLKTGENLLTFSHLTDGPDKGFTIREFKLTPAKSADR